LSVRGGVKKRSLKAKRKASNDLLPPPDDFLPLKEYKEKFGNPHCKANKKAGHKVIRHPSGVKGVVMPAKKGEPWQLQRTFGRSVEDEAVLSECEGSDVITSDAQDEKWSKLVAEEEDKYQDMAVGVSMAELLTLAQAKALQSHEDKEAEAKAKRPKAGERNKVKTKKTGCKAGVSTEDSDSDDHPSAAKAKKKEADLDDGWCDQKDCQSQWCFQ